MIDIEFNTLVRKQGLLTIALNEAEVRADALLASAGNSISDYQEWRAWSLIMKAVSFAIADITEQIGVGSDDLGLYLSELRPTDYQFVPMAEAAAQSFYMDRLHVQDILMASAFDLAKQAVKVMAEGIA